ncbi:hypothetical protein Tco_1492448 [Tanacetum coccineum]
MSLDEASSGVTYTSISSDFEEPSDASSPGVVIYGYDELPMHLVDPYVEVALQASPSPDYVPTSEEPKQAPPSPDYVPGPEYPEYLSPSDAEIPVEDQPYAADASPTALSPGYIADSNPEEDPEDESEDSPMDYLADGGDDDDDDSSGDDTDNKDEEEASEEDEEEKEEHLAPADSTTVSPVAPILFPSEAEVARLLAIPTPPPSLLTPLSSPLPQIPLLPLPVPSLPTTSPTYAEAPLGNKAARIRLRATSPLPSPTSPPTYHPLLLPAPSTSRRADIPEAVLPPQKRLCLAASPRFKVGESSAAASKPTRGYRADYGFIGTLDSELRHD